MKKETVKSTVKNYSHLDYYYFESLLKNYDNASLLNAQGDLLYSKDQELETTLTSRLVVFQNVKKYLKLMVQDVFMTNDPENGGYTFQKIFFIGCLNPNLFIVWVQPADMIQFKIPLSPLLDQGVKNTLVWDSLVEKNSLKDKLSDFFNKQITGFKMNMSSTKVLTTLSDSSFQSQWLNLCKKQFEKAFEVKALGQHQALTTYHEKLIKMSISIEEKQNLKTISFDFSQTQLADKISAASHILESAIIFEVMHFYGLSKYLAQPVLNQVRLSLPPKSVISKAHPTGDYNFSLQALIRQQTQFILQFLNAHKKNDVSKMQIKPEVYIQIEKNNEFHSICLHQLGVDFKDLSAGYKVVEMHQKDHIYQAKIQNTHSEAVIIHFKSLDEIANNSQHWIKLNNNLLSHGQHKLRPKDHLQIYWKV